MIMKKTQILVLMILLAAGNGMDAAWIGYNNPFHEQTFEDNDSIRLRGGSFLELINHKDELGRTFLHQAVKENNLQNVKKLIELGADVNQQNRVGFTFLHMAVIICNNELTRLLIELGADINKQNKDGDTSLHYAVMFNNEIVSLLVAGGADITIKNKLGLTAKYFLDS